MRRRTFISTLGVGAVTAIAGCGSNSSEGSPDGDSESPTSNTPSGQVDTPERQTTDTPTEGTGDEQESYDSYPYTILTDSQRTLITAVRSFNGFADLRESGTVTITQGDGEYPRDFDQPAVWIDTGQTVQFRVADRIEQTQAYTVETHEDTTDEFVTEDTPPSEFSHTFESEGVYMYENPRFTSVGSYGIIVVGRPE
ncbi:hypothetical protein EGH22_00185 [Halomicroarcula sp. F28]|uniref:hypothetical protein n=1 Tax=Haloarcula salinisoli TaxID=2487746 RepID=UPI001C7320E1|nr:hypothetical protein [Halomicroarcula salinisoli]MBX0284734.1 hypothetical protein [Halomicroarcula salinisoli]